ncbi:MAG: hypothetical protein OXC62_08175 [Aestuariivita sp.]|nr:hypothetical protein [Aestuariivita sp.]
MAFRWVHAGIGDGPLLDTLFNGPDARERIAGMLPSEILVHLIGTSTIDMLYPFAYGIFFSGLLYRLGGGGAWRVRLAFLPLIGAGFDLLENLIQISALAGGPDILGFKLALTGPKFVFALLSIIFSFVLVMSAAVRYFQSYLKS